MPKKTLFYNLLRNLLCILLRNPLNLTWSYTKPGFKYKGQIRNHQHASILKRWSHHVLYSPTPELQHPGTLQNSFTASDRCLHQLVERQSHSSSIICTSCSLAPEPLPCPITTPMSSTVASTSSCPSSSLPQPIVQDHFCETCIGDKPPLQPQTCRHRMGYGHDTSVLLQDMGPA